MTYPLATRQDLEEMLIEEDQRIGKLLNARPVSWAAAHRITEGLADARRRKAGLLADLRVLEGKRTAEDVQDTQATKGQAQSSVA